MPPSAARSRPALLALAAAAACFGGPPPAAAQEQDLPPEFYLEAFSAEGVPVSEEAGPADWGIPAGLALSADEALVGDEILETAPPAEPGTPVAFVEDGPLSRYAGRSTWPGGRVPVVFSNEGGSIGPEQRRAFFSACSQWGRVANVRCFPRTNEPVYLTVFWGKGCFAYRGYHPRSERNRISLGEWPGRPRGQCWAPRTVMHEIGHALGLSHEHQRPDRDKYVTVHLANIPPDKHRQFEKAPASKYATRYDLESVMHYPPASLNGRPIITLNRGYERYQGVVGRRDRLSSLDGTLMASLYGRPGSAPKEILSVADEDSLEEAGPAAAEPASDIEKTEREMKEAVERERRRQQASPAPRKPQAKREPPLVIPP